MATRKIVAGPSKWDLLIEALGCLQNVEFTFEGIGKRQVRILSVGLEDGSRESWLITGNLVEPVHKLHVRYKHFKGWYSTKRRHGIYELSRESP